MITQKRLQEVLIYNPCTGEFRWRVSRLKAKPGKLAGAMKQSGRLHKMWYRIIRVDWIVYRASRLAWLYTYGEWPNIIDHIDGNSRNDSIWNLSNGTQVDNMRNPISIEQARKAALARHARSRTLPIESGLATFFETLRS